MTLSVAIAAAALTATALLGTGRRIRARQWSGRWGAEPLIPWRLERAVALEPGNVEQRILVARAWVDESRCDLALPHLSKLDRYFPILPIASELRRVCAAESSAAR